MPDSSVRVGQRWAEVVRRACVQVLLETFEDARLRGLCCEGAWECALGAVRTTPLGFPGGIRLKRVYEPPHPEDGVRILVDRLWPRGLARTSAGIDHWSRDLAPSTALRNWFHQDPKRWRPFAQRYRRELDSAAPALADLLDHVDVRRPMTLLTATRDPLRSHAWVLREHLCSRWP